MDFNTLTITHAEQHSPNQAHVIYELPGVFSAELLTTLDGGLAGSGVSSILRNYTITSLLVGSDLELHLYSYTGLDLAGLGFETGVLLGPGHIRQAQVMNPLRPPVVEERVTSGPLPDHWEMMDALLPGSILDRLIDGDADTLADATSPHPLADIDTAFQWDFLISPSNTVSFEVQLTAVPEPCSLALLGIGIGALGARRFRAFKIKT